MTRLSLGWIVAASISCGGVRSEPPTVEAPVTASPLEARRALRNESLALAAVTMSPAKLPFASQTPASSFVPNATPPTTSWAVADATPTGPGTFSLQAPIAPVPGHPGQFAMRRRDSTAFFTSRGIALSLVGGTRAAPRGWGVHVIPVDARAVQPTAEKQQHAQVHRYVGDAANWETAIPTFGQLAWEELYPGIDMVVEAARTGLEYRFVLSPGAKVSDVILRWDGATSVRVVDGGRGLDVETGIGVVGVRGLRAYAVDATQRRELPARHVMRGSTEVELVVDGWDGRSELVIDPAIGWSSFLGGAITDTSDGLAIDASGNLLVTGGTVSPDFPTTGGFDTTIGGLQDVVVTKISGAGALLWSSFLGGSAGDWGHGIAVDASGNAFVTGTTDSTDFPTTGGFATTSGGGSDAFVAKVSAAGTLMWSSYLGGTATDAGRHIAIDGSGNAIVTGQAGSPNFPTTTGLDTTFGGSMFDVFVTKISSAGALVWSTFLGGTGTDDGYGIAVDASGNVFVTGATNSPAFPTTGGFDTTFAGWAKAFVTKMSSTGAIVWSSYLGGMDHSSGSAIAVDTSGNAFVVGHTYATDFPVTGGFDTTFGGEHDGFVTKISGAGALLWSSYLGGAFIDDPSAVTVDASGNALITGSTRSFDFPTTGGFDTTLANHEAFVTKVSAAGALQWSSFLGGASEDYGRGIAADASGDVFVAGETNSTAFPTPGGFDMVLNGTDAFIARVETPTLALGAACTSRARCLSGFCVDGVCCDKACAGTCEACSASKKGSGADGSCGPTADGLDPDTECTAQSCAGGVVTKAMLCNGTGACRADGTISCGDYACAGTACSVTCAMDTDCAASAFCWGSKCVPDLDNGGACSSDVQCKSGVCADGVCCDKTCNGACEACSAAKKGKGVDGTCEPVTAGTDPKDACAADVAFPTSCKADGMCDGAGACRVYAPAETSCGAPSCSGGIAISKTCNGGGGCEIIPRGCGSYSCNDTATACAEICTNDRECSTGLKCVASACVTPPAEEDGGCRYSSARHRTCGWSAASLAALLGAALARKRRRPAN